MMKQNSSNGPRSREQGLIYTQMHMYIKDFFEIGVVVHKGREQLSCCTTKCNFKKGRDNEHLRREKKKKIRCRVRPLSFFPRAKPLIVSKQRNTVVSSLGSEQRPH
ncbi:hypothetical protein BX666DRAFT_1890258 [Dichotomocladium elegans]|nr:hypothetical protein BX666DRAFT_1890258 [Dichotomocladium elegans]